MRAGRAAAGPAAAVAAAFLCGLMLLVPAAALGARLAGGAEQAAIRRAFSAGAGHRQGLPDRRASRSS